MIFLTSQPKSGISMMSIKRMLEIKSYKTVWVMGHKIRKAMEERDGHYKLGGLVEMDGCYFGLSKPGKRGRRAVGKSKVAIPVENKGDRAGYVKMSLVNRVSGEDILKIMGENLDLDTRLRSDGWRFYGILGKKIKAHEKIVVSKGPQAPKLFPWVHTMIENVKGILRCVHHGVSSKPSGKYLAEFCYKTNRRFRESQLFNRLLHACLNTSTITFAELRV